MATQHNITAVPLLARDFFARGVISKIDASTIANSVENGIWIGSNGPFCCVYVANFSDEQIQGNLRNNEIPNQSLPLLFGSHHSLPVIGSDDSLLISEILD